MKQNRRSGRLSCCRGFSFVEMLIVISVITLLAAIIIPAIGQSGTTARQVVCASNLGQIGRAFQTYKTDLFPRSFVVDGWPTTLEPYVGGQREIYHCPEADPAEMQDGGGVSGAPYSLINKGMPRPPIVR